MALIRALTRSWGDTGEVVWWLYVERVYADIEHIVKFIHGIYSQDRVLSGVKRINRHTTQSCFICLDKRCFDVSYLSGEGRYWISRCARCLKWPAAVDFNIEFKMKSLEMKS